MMLLNLTLTTYAIVRAARLRVSADDGVLKLMRRASSSASRPAAAGSSRLILEIDAGESLAVPGRVSI